MADIKREVYRDLYEKYRAKIEGELNFSLEEAAASGQNKSSDYQSFKREIATPQLTLYEKACNFSEKFLNLKPDAKKAQVLQDAINTAHLNVTPTGTASLGILLPMGVVVFGGILAFLILQSPIFVIVMLLIGAALIVPVSNIPNYMATTWRLKASNQMVLSVFYVVTYMRHTSNLENAIQFASEHLSPPLSIDLKKIIWDVETEKYESIKQSLDAYLETWRKYNMEFVEAFHLIESSLLEGEESRRLGALDKSLDVILEETYEKMLHYAHNLKSPITMIFMLFIILPILGLVILPLIVSFMEVNWLHILFFYDIVLPIAAYLMIRITLIKRPTGYGDSDISEDNPELKKYKNIIINLMGKEIQINPIILSLLIGGILFLIGISPLLIHAVNNKFDIGFDSPDIDDAQFKLLQYIDYKGKMLGPFGIGASVLSTCVPAAFGLGIGLYFMLRSKNVMKIREQTKKLEEEFASALFQLGNRLGDDIPAEMAFGRVADYMQDTNSGKFFSIVSINIQKLGMSVSQAIFDKQRGALLYFPSRIIESSMKVLIESVKKGPRIAAQALTNIARYIKEIHRVNERLKDLMADITSSVNSQIKFMSPVIAGIVVGITSMITTVLAKLYKGLSNVTEAASADGGQTASGISSITDIFGVGIPTFYFQIIVGLYVVEIVYILTILANGIENGSDKLNLRYLLGVNLIRSTLLYCFISLSVMLLFNIIATTILGNGIGG